MSINIQEILADILACCDPLRVILYGEKVVAGSYDLKAADFCIIIEHEDKPHLLHDLYLNVNAPIPVQFLLYNPEEWENMLMDAGSYASAIEKKGTILYGKTS